MLDVIRAEIKAEMQRDVKQELKEKLPEMTPLQNMESCVRHSRRFNQWNQDTINANVSDADYNKLVTIKAQELLDHKSDKERISRAAYNRSFPPPLSDAGRRPMDIKQDVVARVEVDDPTIKKSGSTESLVMVPLKRAVAEAMGAVGDPDKKKPK